MANATCPATVETLELKPSTSAKESPSALGASAARPVPCRIFSKPKLEVELALFRFFERHRIGIEHFPFVETSTFLIFTFINDNQIMIEM